MRIRVPGPKLDGRTVLLDGFKDAPFIPVCVAEIIPGIEEARINPQRASN